MTATIPAVTQRRLTYEEYLEEFRTEAPTRQPYYFLDGVKFMPPSPRPLHQIIVHRIEGLFDAFEEAGVPIRVIPAPMDLLITSAPLRTRQSDILIMSEARYLEAGVPDMGGPVTIAPELVIEVLSPSETRRTIGEKLADYQRIGIRECWLVSSEAETVEVLNLTEDSVEMVALNGSGHSARSVVFPDIVMPVAAMFKR